MITFFDFSLLLDNGISITTLAAVTLLIVWAFRMAYESFITDENFKKGEKSAPKWNKTTMPLATWNTLETLSNLASNDAPWYLLKLARKCERSSFRLPIPFPLGRFVYVIGDYDLSREILLDSTTDKPIIIYSQVNFVFQNLPVMFSSPNDSNYFKLTRKHTSRSFSNNEVSRMRQVCTQHIDEWIHSKLDRYANEGIEFDPSEEMCRLNLEAVLETAFEYKASKEEMDKFCQSLDTVLIEFRERMFNPLRPYLEKFWKPDSQKAANECSQNMLDFASHLLESYRQNPNKSNNNTIIKLLAEDKQGKFSISEQERINEIVGFVIAGHDTSGNTLSIILWLLAKHPRVAEKLREELSKVSPEKWWEQVSYLDHVMKEGMRLYPVAAMFPVRQTGRDFVHPTAGRVPKGAICLHALLVPFRDAAVFENPDDFIPERWEHPTQPMKEAFIPFTFGTRNCPGRNLAVSEIQAVLPALVSKYRFKLAKEGTIEYFLTMKISGAKLTAEKL